MAAPHPILILPFVLLLAAMALAPVQWVSQPAGYRWFGLTGRSDDGGRTFSGRVTDSSACNSFTFRRVGDASAAR